MFVHARNATGKLAATLKEMAANTGNKDLFLPREITSTPGYLQAQKAAAAAKSGQVRLYLFIYLCIYLFTYPGLPPALDRIDQGR